MMSTLTDDQKKRIEENRRKALEKLQNKTKSPISSPLKNQRPVPFGVSSSKSESSSSGNSSNFYSKSFTDALKKAEYGKNKPQVNSNIQRNSVQSPSRGNNNASSLIKNYFSPSKSSSISTSDLLSEDSKGSCPLTSNSLKNYYSPPKSNGPKIHLMLSMKNAIWFKVDHNSRFNDEVRTVAQKITTRQFDNKLRQWNFHIKDYKTVVAEFQKELNVTIQHVPQKVVDILQKAHTDHSSCKDVDLSKIETELLDKLMPFQKDGIRFGVHRKGRILLADDMGLGKTVQAICICAYYKDEWPVLVICPSSVKMSWQQHFVQWIDDVEVTDTNIVNCGKDNPTLGKINIISYDLASKLVGKIYRQQFQIIVADECHFLKNHNAARTKNIVPLLQGTKRAILLSGTPALSRPKELFTQIKALDKNLFPEYHKFSVRYCDGKQTPFGWADNGSTNDSELQALLTSTLMIRRMKHDVLHELPEKQRQIVLLDPSMIKNTKQLIYEEKLFLDSKQDRRSALLNYFQKTCESKLKGVCEYVAEKVEAGCKIIVFAHHMMMLDSIQHVADTKKVSYIRLDGGTNQKHRQIMVDKFNNEENCLLAILSLTACGTGLNITGSSNVIFAELYWNPGHLKQAEDRAYRIGQKNSVLITYLVAKKTADDYIWPMVQHKLKVLTSLGVGIKKGFEGKTTKQVDSRQKSMLDFFETLIEEDEKDFVDQIDNIQGVEESSGVKENTDSKTTVKSEKNDIVCAGTSDNLIADDLLTDDLTADDFSEDILSDDLLAGNLISNNSDEPASKRTKIS